MRLLTISLSPFALCLAVFAQGYNVYTFAGSGFSQNMPALSQSAPGPLRATFDAAGNIYYTSGNAVFRVDASTRQVSNIAGHSDSGYEGDNGPATSAWLNGPAGIAIDPAGSLYVADSGNNVIRKIANGVITTVAGSGYGAGVYPDTGGYSGDNGPATSARLFAPLGVAVDSAGVLYIADTSNNVIRIVSGGIISTIAGDGTPGYSGDGGLAAEARIGSARGLAFDTHGNLFVADSSNNVIRKIAGGVITTVAGSGVQGSSGVGGPPLNLQLFGPADVAIDPAGRLYIADTWNGRVLSVAAGVSSVVSTGGAPYGLSLDATGNLYIADFAGQLDEVSNGILVPVVRGIGAPCCAGNLSDNGLALNAQLAGPTGPALDSAGALFIADSGHNSIRKVANGIITTVAGNGSQGYSGDNGAATAAQLTSPSGVAVDTAGNLYIADTYNNVIREVSGGIITTVAGGGSQTDPVFSGPATSAALSYPYGVTLDAAGNLYIADAGNNLVRKVSQGIISTVAGNGTAGYSGDNGLATAATLRMTYSYNRDVYCGGIAVDAAGSLYIADCQNNVVRKVSGGIITTFAGNGARAYSPAEGLATATPIFFPLALTLDAARNLLIADGNGAVSRVSDGYLTVIAAKTPIGYSGEGGPALTAQLGESHGLAIDSSGDIYLADFFNNVVRVLIPTLSAQSASLSSATNSVSLPVNIPAGFAWTATTTFSWIHLTSDASGSGPGSVTFTLDANAGDARTGTLTIAGQTFTITQQGAALPAGMALAGSLAQIASAGGWDTAFTLVNLDSTSNSVRLNTYSGDGVAPLLPYTFPQTPAAGATLGATFDETLAANSMLVFDTTGPSAQASVVGSAQLLASGDVGGFAIFEIQATGQQAVVPLETRNAPSYLLAFDHTNGLKTGLALANVSAAAGTVKVIVRDDTGAVIPTKTGSIPLLGNGHASFMLDDPARGFPEIEGKRGTVEFDTPSGGQIDVLGLRVNGEAITTLPVLEQVSATGGALAQVATGGGWETGFTLVNTGTSAASFTLSFYDEKTGVPLLLSFVLPQTGATHTAASVTQTLAPGATLLIETQGGSASVTCSAHLTTTGTVSGFAIFRIQSIGQEAVVPLETRTPNAFLLAYDNINGLATGIALANLSAQPALVPVVVRDDTGSTIAQSQIQLAGNGHASFMLTDAVQGFPPIDGKRGTVEFQTPAGGHISALGIRAVNATKVITTIPVLAK